MNTPDAGALPPMKLTAMKPSALPETQTACEVPLIEQLRSVPIDCREMIEVGPCHHRNIPYGRLCHKAADALDDVQSMNLPSKLADCQRALAAATEEKDKELEQWKKIAAEGRWAGRQEAVEILLADDAEDPLDECRESSPAGDSGDYGVQWNEEKLRAKFDAKPGEFKSLYDRVDTALMEMCYSDDQSKLTELERENRELRERATKAEADRKDGYKIADEMRDIVWKKPGYTFTGKNYAETIGELHRMIKAQARAARNGGAT